MAEAEIRPARSLQHKIKILKPFDEDMLQGQDHWIGMVEKNQNSSGMTVLRTAIKLRTSQEAARLSEWKWDGTVIDPPPLKQTMIPGKVAGTYLLINKKFEDRVVIPPSE